MTDTIATTPEPMVSGNRARVLLAAMKGTKKTDHGTLVHLVRRPCPMPDPAGRAGWFPQGVWIQHGKGATSRTACIFHCAPGPHPYRELCRLMSVGQRRIMSCVWNPNLLIGNAKLDEQHRMIFKILDNLLTAISEQKGQKPVVKALAALSVYVASHFKMEEELMAKFGFADLDAHRESHETLRRQVDHMVERFHKEGLNKLELIIFMQDWLGNHIQNVDKQFADFMGSSEQATG
jgi:hemerythrin